MAIDDTRRQWRNFQDQIIENHGDIKGARILCALTRDDPMRDCNGRKIAIVVDSSSSNAKSDPNNLRISAAVEINNHLISAAEARYPTSKPDLVTVVDFDSAARVVYRLGDPAGAHFSGIDSNGGKSIAAGISAAIYEITADTRYTTRDRSGIIVLTDGEGNDSAAQLFQMARASLHGIRVGFGFLDAVFFNGLESRGTSVSASNDIPLAVLEMGGVYSTIDSPEAQKAFVELVLSQGLTGSDAGSDAMPLTKGLGIVGMVPGGNRTSYYRYVAKAGEDATVSLAARSACVFNAELVDVAGGAFEDVKVLEYTAGADMTLGLAITATVSSGAADGEGAEEPKCVFSVQLAGGDALSAQSV
ncbi:hypothetical protein B0T16DRAFT_419888 [Cercophora newfieldiana]|uniref:VWFA domain-containing protein n=1 Tax=Cercophora newfieldiana TaxID=92897 RepID=A0AA39XXN5_9PEZI|nr:hypothetical protein B0T16DRAFT_419888 [Cercophora newfieldiana]